MFDFSCGSFRPFIYPLCTKVCWLSFCEICPRNFCCLFRCKIPAYFISLKTFSFNDIYQETLMALICSTTCVFAVYLPLDDGSAIFHRISKTTDNILIELPSDIFHVWGHFHIKPQIWSFPSSKTDEEDRYYRELLIAYGLT